MQTFNARTSHMEARFFNLLKYLFLRTRSRSSNRQKNIFPSTSEDYLPPSTSEDSENVLSKLAPPAIAKTSPPVAIKRNNERFALSQFQGRQGSLRSLASQTSLESVQDMIRDKEEKWREKHSQDSAKRKVRIQTLI